MDFNTELKKILKSAMNLKEYIFKRFSIKSDYLINYFEIYFMVCLYFKLKINNKHNDFLKILKEISTTEFSNEISIILNNMELHVANLKNSSTFENIDMQELDYINFIFYKFIFIRFETLSDNLNSSRLYNLLKILSFDVEKIYEKYLSEINISECHLN